MIVLELESIFWKNKPDSWFYLCEESQLELKSSSFMFWTAFFFAGYI
jgi:hypothetical protein